MELEANHTLPKLKYSFKDLEPCIDTKTLEIHYTKHHQSYVDGLNKAENELKNKRKNGDFSNVKMLKREISFHSSGHILHSIYWQNMCAARNASNTPNGNLLKFIENKYLNFDTFLKEFKASALSVEGSGWTVLVYYKINSSDYDVNSRLEIINIEKHQDLVVIGAIPLLVCDIWEHAYYLKYKNNRGSYIDNWFKVVDWSDVNSRMESALNGNSNFLLINKEKTTKY